MTVRQKVTAAAIEGMFYALVGIVIAWLLLPSGWLEHNPSTKFARRWDGGCTGWTKSLALLDCLHNLGFWCIYVTIPTALYRLHPTPDRIRGSRTTLKLMVAFISGCGSKHLMDAYCVFNPIYPTAISWGWIVVAISAVAMRFICFSLAEVAVVVRGDREELERYRRGQRR